MVLEWGAVCFLGVSLPPKIINTINMKKIFLLIAAAGMLMGAVSCGEEDEPRRGDGTFTTTTTMFNHMVRVANGEILGIATTQNKLTFDTVSHTGALELRYNDGSTHTVSLTDITGTPRGLGFYELSSHAEPSFSGYIDLFEGPALRYRYTTADGIRIISMTPEVFFRKTHTTVTYDDTTATSTSESAIYQFNIFPASSTATIRVEKIVHDKDLKSFNYIMASNVPYTVTENGFTISGTNLSTRAEYIFYDVATGSSVKTTDKYPFKTFNATIDLVNDRLDATYMIGGSATATATGKTYLNYSF